MIYYSDNISLVSVQEAKKLDIDWFSDYQTLLSYHSTFLDSTARLHFQELLSTRHMALSLLNPICLKQTNKTVYRGWRGGESHPLTPDVYGSLPLPAYRLQSSITAIFQAHNSLGLWPQQVWYRTLITI